ncbi:MAG: glycosyltransferase family 39 protein, partial [Vulcanimicrobiaceae bacterium]
MKSQANAPTSARPLSATLVLGGLIVAGLLLRLSVIGNPGFKNDVQAFESWAMTLATHPFSTFYAKAGFADYPPGYFYVLAVIGTLWEHLFRSSPANFAILGDLVKLPAILADLLVGWLLYALVRRFADERWALGVAAFYLLNPATIVISAIWGQVDSIAGGLALLGVYLLLRSDDEEAERPSWFIVGAWLAFAYSLFIKPQATVLLPLFIAFAFVDPRRRAARLGATVVGALLSLFVVIVLSAPFADTHNPIAVLGWLYGQYNYGKDVYPFNSVNAFNLWTVWRPFWQLDSIPILGLPQYLWGTLLVVASTGLALWRYLQLRTSRALLESSAIALLGFFILATRMHERYIFDGFLFVIACIPLARRYLWAAAALSVTLLLNLIYSFQYLAVATNHTPGVNPSDLWPGITQALSFANVAVFFGLGYLYLGAADLPMTVVRAQAVDVPKATPSGPRGWYDPAEGLKGLRWPLDYAIAAALGIGSFILSYVNYWKPAQKIFDEIYFARAGREYLTHKYIYESTHPPTTK